VILIAASPLNTPRAPIKLTWQVVGLSVVLVSLVCLLAVWLPYRRVQRIDPASVLRA
ncbi:MAG: ABC transporter permease, partial [Planctomycetia bacterium]|nr:ABC transporter permease [Planctomycetia bacterium]